MKKILFFCVLSVFFVTKAIAQNVPVDGVVEYAKGQDKKTSVIELPYSTDVVESAIKEAMVKKGYKEEKIKGVQVFRGVRLDGDTELSDLHFKVERKNKRDKNSSLVHLIVGRSSENVALRTENDHYKSDYARTFLSELVPSVAAYQLELDIKAQEETVKKAEKKLKGLQSDQKSLEKRLQDTQDKLEQNRKDQESQVAELERQKSIMTEMQSRRSLTNQ